MKIFKKTFIILTLFLVAVPLVWADSTMTLRQQIEERSNLIESLEREITAHRASLRQIGQEAVSLENSIRSLDVSHRKLLTEMQITENRIASANLSIANLEEEMADITVSIENSRDSIAAILRNINERENTPQIIYFLTNDTVDEFWTSVEEMRQLQGAIKNNVDKLKELRISVENKKREVEVLRADLITLRRELLDRKEVVEYNRQERSVLLAETQGEQARFEQIVQEKVAQKRQFERELFDFESQLRIAIDPASVPAPRNGFLDWPLDHIYVTQFFGRTVASARLYQSGSHNGVDFRAAVGTPVRSVASGVIEGFGNTDSQPGCFSYGKWILVRHDNGLSTLYAHLSVISVQRGQRVERGGVIGYSGNTGYSTGPHLHLTVYASQGVRIQRNESSNFCKQVDIPMADRRAYFDPMLYLPTL